MDDHIVWTGAIRDSYIRYLRTSFHFRDKALRQSFSQALEREGELVKGPYPELSHRFATGIGSDALASEFFGIEAESLTPALQGASVLYSHQEQAIRGVYGGGRNVVVATGTASGKTECFIYPVLFDLNRQHMSGEIVEPGVRAMVIYPMNALANDQRQRLGNICAALREAGSDFQFTFGQYTGQTPENERDRFRDGARKAENRLPGELVFREEMRKNPPHILLTNYSMLEYLLIRPDDSPLFDGGIGRHWRFIVLDEAHAHRGARGAEMGMLMRRLKQRVRAGGRRDRFNCIATSATISSSGSDSDREEIAEFAEDLFGEPFTSGDVIFGQMSTEDGEYPRRNHAFVRGLESAFLIHRKGVDAVALNRASAEYGGSVPMEIALCRDCGQHYYIGQARNGKLDEAMRDPTVPDFGVEYYLPGVAPSDATHTLCRRCARIWESDDSSDSPCGCGASVRVKLGEVDKNNPDQITACENCGYTRGAYKDPVREIVHGADGPNAVIATTLHQLLPAERRKVLSFVDNRQEAAFFAWYIEDTYQTIAARNLILKAMRQYDIEPDGLKPSDLANRLVRTLGDGDGNLSTEERRRNAHLVVWREALTEERRLSLSGVGLVRWRVRVPDDLSLSSVLGSEPWSFTPDESRDVVSHLLEMTLNRYAVDTPDVPGLSWRDITPRPQRAYKVGAVGRVTNVSQWGHERSAAVDYLVRLLGGRRTERKVEDAQALMNTVWRAVRDWDKGRHSAQGMLVRAQNTNNGFRLNPEYLRVDLVDSANVWECGTCAGISLVNIRGICPKYRCVGWLAPTSGDALNRNHYRLLYEGDALPLNFRAEEHTAQIETEEAKTRQDDFKAGNINLLSSSTTFEMGVDLGDLDVAFLRNIPPETFNYSQRVGRVGRRDRTGFAVSYCRRNPHDLYHFEDPQERVMGGVTRPPLVQLENRKIILRHMASVALSMFFKQGAHEQRFKNVRSFVGDSSVEELSVEMRRFCHGYGALEQALLDVVPQTMWESVGLSDGAWIDNLFGPESRFYGGVAAVLGDIEELEAIQDRHVNDRKYGEAGRVEGRLEAVRREPTLNFLSRSVILPKYGFPVDSVELQIRSGHSAGKEISLQRNLSQAIAEYAPGSEIVANKKVWQSSGIRLVPGQAPVIKYYRYDDAGNFEHALDPDELRGRGVRQYFTPQWGFTTELDYKPKEPFRQSERLYVTRPFFGGFQGDVEPDVHLINGVSVSVAAPGSLYILSEGRQRGQFHICLTCGRHSDKRLRKHKTLYGADCGGRMGKYSYGYELATDVVRLMFPSLGDSSVAWSLAYAILLGTADALGVPQQDLNVTLANVRSSEGFGSISIVLYDDVPGGAGFVARLSRENVFKETLRLAEQRVSGGCGCDSSCYGCLRSYRNQFAHRELRREAALTHIRSHRGTGTLIHESTA